MRKIYFEAYPNSISANNSCSSNEQVATSGCYFLGQMVDRNWFCNTKTKAVQITNYKQ